MKWTLFPFVLLLTACDPTPPPQPETERSANPVFETQIQAIEKAKAVEGQVMDAAEAQRKQMEAESQ
ncbi:MAG TPA: hypothetical protein VIN38_04630 [Thiobacillus sp.]